MNDLKMLRNFRLNYFILAIIGFGILTFTSLIAFVAIEEGTAGNSLPIVLLSKPYDVLRFPMHTLFFERMMRDFVFFFLGLFINVILYAFLTERMIHLFKTKA